MQAASAAVDFARRAVHHSKATQPGFLATLARAYFLTGDAAAATSTAQQAPQLAEPGSPLASSLRRALDLYRGK